MVLLRSDKVYCLYVLVVKSPGFHPHSIYLYTVFLFLHSLSPSPFYSLFLPLPSLFHLHLHHCCFPLNIFCSSSLQIQLWASPPSLCNLAMLVLWLQGFPMCIYSVFIGTEPCFLSAYQQPPCTPPTNLPDTALGFQDTTGPGCSHSQLTRPWCLSSPSLIRCFLLKCSQIPWFVSCWFMYFFFHHPAFIIPFFLPPLFLSANPVFGVSP